MNVVKRDDKDFCIKLSEIEKHLTEEEFKEFLKWMYGKTSAIEDGELCVYVWDWERYYSIHKP